MALNMLNSLQCFDTASHSGFQHSDSVDLILQISGVLTDILIMHLSDTNGETNGALLSCFVMAIKFRFNKCTLSNIFMVC